DARDNRAEQRQQNDGFVHAALASPPTLFPLGKGFPYDQPDHALPLQQIDVFDRDRSAVAEIGDENSQTDRGFSGRDRQHNERVDLSDDVAEKTRERDQVDIDREQDQLDRHQDDDDVLAVEKDSENAEREHDRRNRKIVAKPDRRGGIHGSIHGSPCPDFTLTISIAVALLRATCWAMIWRRTFGLWWSVSTMAPIIA